MGKSTTSGITVALRLESKGLYDLHGHFLPGMDDGCKTAEESVRVLQSSKTQGIRAMFATLHYYPKETVASFLKRREASAAVLQARIREEYTDLPAFCLGAEVAYYPGLVYEEQLDKLCLGTSRYLLLELPLTRWPREVLRDLHAMQNVRGITPILAHIERYFAIQDKDIIADILDSEVLIQMNAAYFLDLRTRRKGRSLLKSGAVQFLGADCHNMTKRPPNLGLAAAYLEKKGMGEALDQAARLSGEIFRLATDK